MIRESYIILWRKQDGEVWNEAGEVDTLEIADRVAKKLRELLTYKSQAFFQYSHITSRSKGKAKMKCQRCGSDRILQISAKCSDLCSASYKELEKDGYTPDLPFTEYGDYLCPTICMECGQVQGEFPITDKQVRKGWNN